jgi:hypothetical protein
MSALGCLADIRRTSCHVRLVPFSTICSAANDVPGYLFDHLVSAGEQRRRHVEAKRFGGL